jgi:MFS transporter, OCT family, solute carrier family 22 (organic cation transporter), member 4/5
MKLILNVMHEIYIFASINITNSSNKRAHSTPVPLLPSSIFHPQWDLVCEKDYYATMALVIFGISGLIGNYIFGYLQDLYGRKPSFYIYLVVEIVACVSSAFTWSFTSWILLRAVVGLTVPAILASPYVLAIEMVGPERRVFCTIVSNIAYSIGLTLLAGVVYMFRDWRALSLAVALPLTLLFLCFFSLPESPRWLIATHKFKRAAKVMKTIAR